MANREGTCVQKFSVEISISISFALNGTCVKTPQIVSKYYNQDYLKPLFLVTRPSMMIQVSYFGSKKDDSTKKLSMTKVESFLKPVFNKPTTRNSVYESH